MDDPDLAIEVGPIMAEVSESFILGKEAFEATVNECHVIYEGFPDDQTYNDKGSCMSIPGLNEAAEEIISRLRG